MNVFSSDLFFTEDPQPTPSLPLTGDLCGRYAVSWGLSGEPHPPLPSKTLCVRLIRRASGGCSLRRGSWAPGLWPPAVRHGCPPSPAEEEGGGGVCSHWRMGYLPGTAHWLISPLTQVHGDSHQGSQSEGTAPLGSLCSSFSRPCPSLWA